MAQRMQTVPKARQPVASLAPAAHEAGLPQRVRQFLQDREVQGVDELDIEVDGGTVVLRGNLASKHERWLCVNCAGRVAGVRLVIDQLRVKEAEKAKDGRKARRPR